MLTIIFSYYNVDYIMNPLRHKAFGVSNFLIGTRNWKLVSNKPDFSLALGGSKKTVLTPLIHSPPHPRTFPYSIYNIIQYNIYHYILSFLLSYLPISLITLLHLYYCILYSSLPTKQRHKMLLNLCAFLSSQKVIKYSCFY